MDQKDSQSNYPTIKDFVLQEALEKAFEINVLGLKDFQKAKSEMLLERQEALHQELDKKHKEQLAAKRIHKSSLINRSRMQKMEMRHKNLLEIISKTQVHICQKIISNQSVYRKLLKDLIVEGLIKLLEPIVHIRCLRRDSGMVTGVLADAKAEFAALIHKEGMDPEVANVDLKVDQKYWLEQKKADTPQDATRGKDQDMNKCFGGVILTNEGGLIVCKNTLDARIELAYQHMLPIIRSSLFN